VTVTAAFLTGVDKGPSEKVRCVKSSAKGRGKKWPMNKNPHDKPTKKETQSETEAAGKCKSRLSDET